MKAGVGGETGVEAEGDGRRGQEGGDSARGRDEREGARGQGQVGGRGAGAWQSEAAVGSQAMCVCAHGKSLEHPITPTNPICCESSQTFCHSSMLCPHQ